MSVPPGASYQASNTYVKFKRHLLNLEPPVRIRFDKDWKEGNPLYDWYRRHDPRIYAMELRRERNAPFFHQYIVFKLQSNRFFRVDRRQLPDENTPLDCIYEQGVEAYDTIEEVTSFEDPSYSPSDCLVGIEFLGKVSLGFVLKILWAIHQHPSARVYTLQRYNCYFVAQTIIFTVAKSDKDFHPERPQVDYSSSIPPLSTVARASTPPARQHPHEPTRSYHPLSCALLELFRQLGGGDQGLHNMCLTHFRTCLLCTGERTPSSTPFITLNASGRISNNSDRHYPTGFTNAIILRFHASLTGFWRQALSAALGLESQTADREEATHTLPEMNAHKQGQEEPGITKSSWAECVRGALERLAKDLDPIMQRTLDCSTWDPSLILEVGEARLAYLRRMDNWVEVMFGFFESKYDQLEEAFESELRVCLSPYLSLDPSRYSKMYFGNHNNQTIPEPSDPKVSKLRHLMVRLRANRSLQRKPDSPKSDIAITEVLVDYLDDLIMTHCVRVEQYGRWLKCTRSGVYWDISRARGEILRVVEDFSSRWAGCDDIKLTVGEATDSTTFPAC